MPDHWIEVHWPHDPGDRLGPRMWMYYHEDKWKKDREVHRGDRVLFYETRTHPEEDWRGAETIFAIGTVKKEKGEPIRPPVPRGGKLWNWRREVRANVLPPATGVPMEKIRKALGWGERATLRRSPMWVSPKAFKRIEAMLGVEQRKQRVRVARGGRVPRQLDPEKRAKLERRAVEVAVRYYERLGYDVRSVERDNLGWDLEAESTAHTLKVEVKGLSAKEVSVELTPNEFRAMRKVSLRPVYRLFVVTNALVYPKCAEFFYSASRDRWMDGDDRLLQLRRIVGARAWSP